MSCRIRWLLFWRLCYAECLEPWKLYFNGFWGDVFRRVEVEVGGARTGGPSIAKARLIVTLIIAKYLEGAIVRTLYCIVSVTYDYSPSVPSCHYRSSKFWSISINFSNPSSWQRPHQAPPCTSSAARSAPRTPCTSPRAASSHLGCCWGTRPCRAC